MNAGMFYTFVHNLDAFYDPMYYAHQGYYNWIEVISPHPEFIFKQTRFEIMISNEDYSKPLTFKLYEYVYKDMKELLG